MRESHPATPDVNTQGTLFIGWSRENVEALRPHVVKYGERRQGEPEALLRALPIGRAEGGFGLLRDLQDLWLLTNESTVLATVLLQASRALKDAALTSDLTGVVDRNQRQRTWLLACIRAAAPQTLTVPP